MRNAVHYYNTKITNITNFNKMLSFSRLLQCSVSLLSLNITQSHLKLQHCIGHIYKLLLVFHYKYVCLVLFLRYSTLNSDMPLKSGLVIENSTI